MYLLFILVYVPAAIIAFLEFPPIIKDKRLGDLLVVFSFWLVAVVLSSLLVLGYELMSPLSTLINVLPDFLKPVVEFLLP